VADVEDTGIGISVPSRIFEAFFTTKEKGMGIGFAICQSIIAANGGARCRQSKRRRRSLQLFASSLSQHCAPAVSSCPIASKCKWLDECELNRLIGRGNPT
jgi:K+-sensing histidine kinase KdpD